MVSPETAKELKERIDQVEHEVDLAHERLRELRYALELQSDPELAKTLDSAEDPTAGISGEAFLQRHG